MFFGIITILVLYALIPDNYRYSRAIIIAGTFWGFISLSGYRFILQLAGISAFNNEEAKKNRIVVVGSIEESNRVAGLIGNMQQQTSFIGLVGLDEKDRKLENVIGLAAQLQDIIRVYSIGEVIFCAKDLSAQHIIDQMIQLQDQGVDYKIAPQESMAIIGSNSINAHSDLFMIEVDSVSKPQNKRNKRLMDMGLSLLFFLTLPLNIWMVKDKLSFVKNIFCVLFSQKTWVAYYLGSIDQEVQLPNLKKGVLNPGHAFANEDLSDDTLSRLNLLYSRDYKITTDLEIIWKGFSYLGN